MSEIPPQQKTLSQLIRENMADLDMQSANVADDCIQAVCDALNDWFGYHVTVTCAYEGVSPASVPDPVTVDTWSVDANIQPWAKASSGGDMETNFNQWVSRFSSAIVNGTRIKGAGTLGVTLTRSLPILQGSFIISQNTLKSKMEDNSIEDKCEAIWDYIEDTIKAWILASPALSSDPSATHGVFTGVATQTANIIT